MKQIFVLWCLFFCSLQAWAQHKKEFISFLKLFPETTLPACYEYNDSALVRDEEYGIIIGVEEKDSALVLPENLVQKFLLQRNESLYYADGTDSAKYLFYPLHQVLKTRKFYGITYERLQLLGQVAHSSSEKYFATFDKKGNLISSVEIAFCVRGGSSLMDYEEEEVTDADGVTEKISSFVRVPWHPRGSGCITRHSVHLKSELILTETNYKIDRKGRIIKTK